jgi:hypothetical protein
MGIPLNIGIINNIDIKQMTKEIGLIKEHVESKIRKYAEPIANRPKSVTGSLA